MAAVCLALVAGGCSNVALQPNASLLGTSKPYVYSDQDWAVVLQSHVHDGLVDYEALKRDQEPLHRYYALLSQTGPSTTPDQFAAKPQVVAYWINAYNALVVMVVLKNYPATSIYDLKLPNPDYDYTFQVDGRPRTLADIEKIILEQSEGDVRTLLATSRGAVGTPKLSGQPMRASTLERQLALASEAALDDPHVLRIDNGAQSIELWQVILRRQEDFLNYWRSRRRVETAYLFNVLLELASPQQRRALQTAVGYAFREIPFDRSLNSMQPPATRAAAD